MQLETKGVMTGLTRLMNSPNGNPRWMVHMNSGSWRTAEDSQCGHQLSEAMVGQVVELTIEHGKVRRVVALP